MVAAPGGFPWRQGVRRVGMAEPCSLAAWLLTSTLLLTALATARGAGQEEQKGLLTLGSKLPYNLYDNDGDSGAPQRALLGQKEHQRPQRREEEHDGDVVKQGGGAKKTEPKKSKQQQESKPQQRQTPKQQEHQQQEQQQDRQQEEEQQPFPMSGASTIQDVVRLLGASYVPTTQGTTNSPSIFSGQLLHQLWKDGQQQQQQQEHDEQPKQQQQEGQAEMELPQQLQQLQQVLQQSQQWQQHLQQWQLMVQQQQPPQQPAGGRMVGLTWPMLQLAGAGAIGGGAADSKAGASTTSTVSSNSGSSRVVGGGDSGWAESSGPTGMDLAGGLLRAAAGSIGGGGTAGGGAASGGTANGGGGSSGGSGTGGGGGGGSGWWRVLGGQNADKSRHRYIASLRDPSGRHFCGGSLVAPEVVITAAHCVDRPDDADLKNPVVHIGRYFTDKTDSQGFEVRRCKTVVVHPGWSYRMGQNDLALCLLDRPSTRPPITVAAGNLKLDGQTALLVVGFGAVAEGAQNYNVLQEAVVYPQDIPSCNKTYSGLIGKGQLCVGRALGGVDACQGDSGGPLVMPRGTPATVFSASSASATSAPAAPSSAVEVLLGVVSWGRGCGVRGQPGVYTNLARYRTWIDQQLAKFDLDPLAGPAFVSADQLEDLISSYYSCQSQPSGEDLQDLAKGLSEQGLEFSAALAPLLATYSCKPNASVKEGGSASSSNKPSPSPAAAAPKACPDGSKPQSGGKCPPAAAPNPCSCTTDGRSGSAATPLKGCAQHGAATGDYLFYCMVAGGAKGCPSAVPSRLFPGAAWMECGGKAANGSGGGAQSASESAPEADAAPPVMAFGAGGGGGSGGGVSGGMLGAGVWQSIFAALLGRR